MAPACLESLCVDLLGNILFEGSDVSLYILSKSLLIFLMAADFPLSCGKLYEYFTVNPSLYFLVFLLTSQSNQTQVL